MEDLQRLYFRSLSFQDTAGEQMHEHQRQQYAADGANRCPYPELDGSAFEPVGILFHFHLREVQFLAKQCLSVFEDPFDEGRDGRFHLLSHIVEHN